MKYKIFNIEVSNKNLLINKLFAKSYNNDFITGSSTALILSSAFTLVFIGKLFQVTIVLGKNEYLYTLLDMLWFKFF